MHSVRLLFALTCYVVQNRISSPETAITQFPNAAQHSTKEVIPATKNITPMKNCACCNKKLSPAQEKAKQRQQARETWARQLIANYGYEEGMKRITAKFPLLAKQMQRILDREKRLGQTSTVSQSDMP